MAVPIRCYSQHLSAIILMTAAMVAVSAPRPARAQGGPPPCTVNTTTVSVGGVGNGWSGDFTFCVNMAGLASGPDMGTINFDPTVFSTPQTITLSSTPSFLGNFHINGPGANLLTLTVSTAVPVLSIASGTTGIVSGVTIANSHPLTGGAIANHGTLAVSGVTFTGNFVGIYNDVGSTATVTNSTFWGNATYNGGGIFNAGTLTLSNSTLSGNSVGGSGGGIYNTGTLAASNVTISGNTAGSSGGGIANPGAR